MVVWCALDYRATAMTTKAVQEPDGEECPDWVHVCPPVTLCPERNHRKWNKLTGFLWQGQTQREVHFHMEREETAREHIAICHSLMWLLERCPSAKPKTASLISIKCSFAGGLLSTVFVRPLSMQHSAPSSSSALTLGCSHRRFRSFFNNGISSPQGTGSWTHITKKAVHFRLCLSIALSVTRCFLGSSLPLFSPNNFHLKNQLQLKDD